ncbi:MAG: SBBP repeat-containing protein, partial [Planctomycetes bacterium]|nr:SBBP repeat-containing protein [Planctomycetota bacterium]
AQLSLAGGTDAFVARFYPTLFANRNITYFGGASTDQGFAIAVDPESGDVYIAGTTSSESLPGLGAAAQGDLRGVRDAFVARFKDDLTPPVRSTYVGGGDSDKGYAMAIAASGDRVYVAGDTTSDDFPGAGVGAQPENAGAGDVFVARIHTDLTWIERSTYLGGSGQDMGLGIAVNSESGDVYVTGLTSSEDFPRTEGGAQPVHGGGPPVFYRDAFVTRLDAGIGVRSIHVSPAALAFPFIAPGERTGLEVEIANRGVRALAVSAFELSDVTNFACRTGAPPACPDPPFALEPGEACTLQVEYAPPAPGEHRAELSVLSDDPSAPRVTLRLEGGAVAGSWIVETVGRGARSVDLVVDESDRVHLCYFVPPSPARGAALRYATHIIPDPFLGALPMPRPEWTFETIADLAEVGTDCSMAVERDGTWHIAYVVEEILYYLRRGSAPILIAEGVLPECSIALDSSEAPFIAYSPYTIYNPLTGAREHPVPHCAYVPLPDPGSMRISLIPGLDMPGRTGGAGPWTDIAFAPPGFEIPWAVFPVDGELILYEIDPGELCFPPDGPAVATAHHAPRVFPQSCQIAIHTSDWSNPFTLAGLDGRDGAATVRKFEMAPEGIRYDHDPLWPEVEYITTGGGAAEPYLHLSLPRHLYHMPNLALYDRYETSLKYVWINASYQSLERCPLDTCAQRVRGQVTERVDEAGDVGAGAQTDMDPSYNPHIAYLDDTNGTVKYARRIHPSGASVAVSPTRWIFGHRDDWRAFFIWARGTGEAVVHDVRIENAVEGRPEDWRVITDCDLEEGEVIGEDLLGGFSSTMRPVCVEIAPGAVPPCRADLVVETSAGTARAELLYGVWPRDGDGDGVWDGEEGPGGDGNGDGVPDDEQDHVASAQALDGWSYLTVTSPHGTELRDVDVISNPSPDDAPPGVAFPFGFLRFRVIDLSPGDAIDVDVHVSGGWTIDAYWMHGPTPDHPAPHWYEFVFDGTTGAEITGSTITLHFVDGLRGDADITANGTIVDPGAPAVVGMVLFRRGDANVDGGADMSDAVAILGHLFLGGPLNDCEDAADVNDDGRMDISDAVRLLLYLFLGSAQPPEPFMTCGGDPTADDLGCNTFSRCP